jgi:hypothetical protein
MSSCTDFRRALLADPGGLSQELRLHGSECADCAAYADRAARFETRLENALRLKCAPVAGTGAVAEVVPLRRAAKRSGARSPAVGSRWLALAASLAVAAATAVLWIAVPRASLAGDVVTHMAGEPSAWRVTDDPVSPAELSAVILNAHMRLKPSAGVVSYASSCEFRGHLVPHLVVQDQTGPVTVMVLIHESVKQAVDFDEQHYRGVILPVPGHGAIAVLTRNETLDRAALMRIAARVDNGIDWTG